MKRAFNLTGWCCAMVALWASASAPAFAADHFAKRFPLQLEEGAAYYSVTLPAAVYAASERGDLGDVRVFNGAGEPVPYSLDAAREPARVPPALHRVNWFPLPPVDAGSNSSAPFGVTIAADGSLHATSAPPARAQHDTDLIDAGRGSPKGTSSEAPHANQVSALLVHMRDDNFQGRVTVEASDDLRHWQPVGNAQLLKVSYNGSTLSQDRIELDGTRARYLRLHWLDGVPFVDSMEMEVQTVAADKLQQADRIWNEVIVARAGPKAGEYFFVTGGPYPVDRLRLNLPQPNTVAPAVVYSRAGLDAPWRQVASATLFRLHNGDVEQSNPALELPPDTDRQWRVMVDTRSGGLGAGTLALAAGWRPATLTFVARGVGPFTLAVGSEAAVSSAVSRGELLMGGSSVIATARVGGALPGSLQTDAQSASGDADARRRYLLWAALVLAVGSLGLIAWRLARGARVHAGGAVDSGAGASPGRSGAAGSETAGSAAESQNGQGDGKA